ncbi:oxidoreductase, putative [Trypanosoma equiperdum]|uniref:Oxidoreductase, putative n=2 Tax=Trypanozoon TaxID=39700 RepID=Q38A19_TRYB2|nr:oxidoreductase, putative [Trypanosoma brucei brucei TREU927]EAN78351.1 oxidoreductase, putative [Trypanosoma brucei brucei TREU927]SCU69272.1 oxidoreductase, putative [Trypanosoma equiperdum]
MQRKIVAKRLSSNFREATEVLSSPIPSYLKSTELLVKNRFVGINASDINFTSGKYLPGTVPPFDCGFEALGEVVAVGDGIKQFCAGDVVVTQAFGAFCEYQVVPSRSAKKVPLLKCEYLPLDLSGTTASISIGEILKPLRGELAVVTAAGGGTGQFAVQILKKVYDCTVVGVTSSCSKENMLKELGCDHVIVGERESVGEAMKQLMPTGVNVAYESVGGDMLDVVVDNISLRGRVLSIGGISGYSNGGSWDYSEKGKAPLPMRLLSKSASLNTFFLPHYIKYAKLHFSRLCQMYEQGTLQSCIDPSKFKGLEAVADAVEYMYERRNKGKVIVEI